MLAMKAEIEAKKNDEDAQKEAQEREAKMRIDMEFAIEQEKLKQAREEAERQERIRKEEAAIKRKQEEYAALESKLDGVLPQVNEANMIAAELKREVRFNVKMVSTMPDFGDLKDSKREFKIKVDNKEEGYFYMWDPEKFTNRLFMMRENVNEFFDTGVIPDFSNHDEDAFWDPPEAVLIGTSYLKLQNLGYCLESDGKISIFSTSGSADGKNGEVDASYWPVTATGEEDLPDDLLVEQPEELLGKEIFFRVDIKSCKNLPMDLCKDVYVTYAFKHEPEAIYRTDELIGKNPDPTFSYSKQHTIDCVSEYILEYFKTGHIVIKTYG